MTAAIGAEAAGAAGAEGAGAGAAGAAGRAAPSAAPTASAPVGSTAPGAGRAGAKPRTQRQLKSGGKKSSGGGQAAGAQQSSGKGPQAKKVAHKALHHKPLFGGRGRSSGARKLIVGEFVLCAVIVAFSPMTTAHKGDSPGALIKRLSAIAALFLLLGLLSSGGRGGARVAAAFGGLVTVALMVSDREVFSVIASRFAPGAGESTGPLGPEEATASDGSTSQSGAGESTGGLPEGNLGGAIGGAIGPAIGGIGGGIIGQGVSIR